MTFPLPASSQSETATMWKQVTLVTGNENKWQEIQAILGDSITLEREDIDCIMHRNWLKLIRLVPELQGSIEEIATAKCREAAERISGPVIVEDTALCFNALGGLPGPYIKSFLTKLGHEGLNRMLMGFGDNGAQAVCTFAFCSGPNQKVTLLQGITEVLLTSSKLWFYFWFI